MMRGMHFSWPLMLALVVLCQPHELRAAADPVPLVRAHSHNDYEHARPLLDALDQGFCSVEADVHLVNGRLLVAHDADKVQPERTLEKLYLDPLQARVRERRGRVFKDGPPVLLLIDFKTAAGPTYDALKRVLEPYRSMLTRFHADRTEPGAVMAVVSGNRPIPQMLAETSRLAACDARFADLTSGNASTNLFPLVSESWNSLFRWRGEGLVPAEERERLVEYVGRAHSQGRRIRFWTLPDQEAGWQLAHEARVDLINTDRLAELARFLRSHAP